MATTKPASSTTPSSLNFHKEGLLLPGRNRRLFAVTFTILVAWISFLLIVYEFGVEPIELEVGGDMDALMSTYSGGLYYALLLQEAQKDYRFLLLATAAYLMLVDVTGSVIQLVSIFAAVTTYSSDSEVHTFGSLLGKAKQQLKGDVLAVAFICALKTAAIVLLLASSALAAFLVFRQPYYWLFLAGCLVLLTAFIFYIFLSFFCSLVVVMAVGESAARRHHGASMVERAWQLVKGRQRCAMLFISVMSLLAATFRPIYWRAKKCAHSNMASWALLLGALYPVLMAGLKLFHDCTLTAFYYECKGRSTQESEEYIKLSI